MLFDIYTFKDKFPVFPACCSGPFAESVKDSLRILPIGIAFAHDHTVPGIRIGIQLPNIVNKICTQGI